MPPGLHAELARAAEREAMSLNGYIIARLGESVDEGSNEGRPSPRDASSRTVTRLLVANVAAVALAGLVAVAILVVALIR